MAFRRLNLMSVLAVSLVWNAAGLTAHAEAALRVISLYAAHTENVVALGAADLLVAVSASDDPELLPGLPRIPLKAGAERFLALKPDIILARSFTLAQNPNLFRTLGDAGIKIAAIDLPTWDSFPGYLRELAGLLGVNPDGAIDLFRKTSEALAEEAKQRSKGRKAPSVFVESTSPGLRTCAPNSWAARLIALAGGKNAVPEAGPMSKGSAVAAWGLERTLRTINSGLDVYIVQHGAMNAATLEDVKRRPWFSALKHTIVAEMPEAYLSRPSLAGMEKGGKMLINIFYGE